MSTVPRRKLSEIRTRYTLEPNLEDYYVEGSFDKEIVAAIQSRINPGVKIYEIDTIEIPSETLQKHGLTSGNKQRVIALAKELSDLDEEVKFRCFVDKDLDEWLDRMQEAPRLKWTGPTSIELYFFCEDIIKKIVFASVELKPTTKNYFLNH